MENTIYQLTGCGGHPIIVKQEDVTFVVIPVFELEGENNQILLDSDSMNTEFQYMMDYLKMKYPKN
jgi:hypothetical protein